MRGCQQSLCGFVSGMARKLLSVSSVCSNVPVSGLWRWLRVARCVTCHRGCDNLGSLLSLGRSDRRGACGFVRDGRGSEVSTEGHTRVPLGAGPVEVCLRSLCVRGNGQLSAKRSRVEGSKNNVWNRPVRSFPWRVKHNGPARIVHVWLGVSTPVAYNDSSRGACARAHAHSSLSGSVVSRPDSPSVLPPGGGGLPSRTPCQPGCPIGLGDSARHRPAPSPRVPPPRPLGRCPSQD